VGDPRAAAAQKRAREKSKQESQIRGLILDAVLAKVPASLGRAELELITQAAYDRLWHEHQKDIVGRRGWTVKKHSHRGGLDLRGSAKPYIAKMTPAELGRCLVEISLIRDLSHSPYDRAPAAILMAAAKRYKVNVNAVRAAAQREASSKRTKPAAKKGGRKK
jgi:hypothetical protein